MTDPIFGDNPIDPGELWDSSFRPPLLEDPEWITWRNVWEAWNLENLESQWLTRWRRAVTTAEDAQLDLWGEQLAFLRPDGWTDARYSAVLQALYAVSYTMITTDRVVQVADALLDVGQSYTFVEEYPATARFTFLDTPAEDAITYFAVLNNRTRNKGTQYYLVAHPGGLGPDPFTIDTSTIDGPDTLADLFA